MASSMGIQEAWAGISDPMIMNINFETRLHLLPSKGRIFRPGHFWSGDYWASNKGLIDYRWNAPRDFSMSAPSKFELARMSESEIATLSPAEKFDLLNGRYHYPLKNEVQKNANFRAQNWEGICHGVAPASINHKEPRPKILTNQDGFNIPFGSSDIKALISYYYAYPYQVPNTHQVGRRCEIGIVKQGNCKQDLNAGAFHIILSNRIALENKSFIADINRYSEVWNHPVTAYTSVVTSEGVKTPDSATGTVRRVGVKTTLSYIDSGRNSWGQSPPIEKNLLLKYTLELNSQGQIIGGVWRSQNRPDFLWIKEKFKVLLPSYRRLEELLND
jgi:hypothetical protein